MIMYRYYYYFLEVSIYSYISHMVGKQYAYKYMHIVTKNKHQTISCFLVFRKSFFSYFHISAFQLSTINKVPCHTSKLESSFLHEAKNYLFWNYFLFDVILLLTNLLLNRMNSHEINFDPINLGNAIFLPVNTKTCICDISWNQHFQRCYMYRTNTVCFSMLMMSN